MTNSRKKNYDLDVCHLDLIAQSYQITTKQTKNIDNIHLKFKVTSLIIPDSLIIQGQTT